MKRVSAVTSNYDAVVMPTCAIAAPTLDEVSTPDGFTRKNMLLLRNTTVGNFLDRCGISLPCHAAGELPVGFMLMGEAMADKRVLAWRAAWHRWSAADRLIIDPAGHETGLVLCFRTASVPLAVRKNMSTCFLLYWRITLAHPDLGGEHEFSSQSFRSTRRSEASHHRR